MPRTLLTAVLSATLATPLAAAELSVGAATALSGAFTELAHAYTSHHPGDDINLQFAPSALLLQQQRQPGTGFDLVALNDEAAMDEADSAGLVRAATRQRFASNKLLLVVPDHSALPVRSVLDLGRNAVKRVALENSATTAAGRFSRLALMQAGIWKTVEAKAVWVHNAQEGLELVARGEADAGFALSSDAQRRADAVREVAQLPTQEPIGYALASTTKGRLPRLAGRFAEFVASPEGQAILEKHGFEPAAPASAERLSAGGKSKGH